MGQTSTKGGEIANNPSRMTQVAFRWFFDQNVNLDLNLATWRKRAKDFLEVLGCVLEKGTVLLEY
ncbi:MAG: hypothetical protein QXQ02_01040 [Halobacteria archaeon]